MFRPLGVAELTGAVGFFFFFFLRVHHIVDLAAAQVWGFFPPATQ